MLVDVSSLFIVGSGWLFSHTVLMHVCKIAKNKAIICTVMTLGKDAPT